MATVCCKILTIDQHMRATNMWDIEPISGYYVAESASALLIILTHTQSPDRNLKLQFAWTCLIMLMGIYYPRFRLADWMIHYTSCQSSHSPELGAAFYIQRLIQGSYTFICVERDGTSGVVIVKSLYFCVSIFVGVTIDAKHPVHMNVG